MRSHRVRISVVVIGLLLVSPLVAAEPAYRSHPPMRTLPVATNPPLERGTTYFVDAA